MSDIIIVMKDSTTIVSSAAQGAAGGQGIQGIPGIQGPAGAGFADGNYGDIAISGGVTALTINPRAVTYAKMQNVSATDVVLGRSSVGAGSVEEIACTATGRSVIASASALAARAVLGLVIGSDVAPEVHGHAWSDISATPTTLGGYGITDAYTKIASDARFAPIAVPWASITGPPTTLGGYGITDAQPLDADLTAIAALSTTGYAKRTAANTWSLAASIPWTDVSATPTTLSGYGITDAYTKTASDARFAPIAVPWASITGTPTTLAGYGITDAQPLDADLTAIAAFAGTGIPARTAANTWAQRSIAGTAARIAVANGDGVAGNPTVDIDAAYVGQASITTLGTIGTGVWNADAVTSSGVVQGTRLVSTVATGTAPLTVTSTTRVANLNVASAGNADTVTTNANLTGPITSTGNATAIASQTGTGSTFAMQASPQFSGNVGIGCAPSAWNASTVGLQVGPAQSSSLVNIGGDLHLCANAYSDGAGVWRYVGAGFASNNYMTLADGLGNGIVWRVAASGAAGAAITWIEGLRVFPDGRVCGKALHNNANAVTGTTNQYIASGTYTATLTTGSGTTGGSGGTFNWLRVGNVVVVSGLGTLTTSAAGGANWGVSLPIGSTLSTQTTLSGGGWWGNGTSTGVALRVIADTTNNRIAFTMISPGAATNGFSFTCTYLVS